MKIFCKFPSKIISKLDFWLVICIAKDLIWKTLKVIFSIFLIFLHPQIPYFPEKAYLFSFQIMYTSQFKKDPYDWFCGPRSHMNN